jgi:DNA-binding Xre family transcriptional regulator
MAKYSIGHEIKKVVKKRGLSVEDMASFLNVSKPNIFDIYKRETIDTGLLERICKVLNYNFFQHFSNKYTTDYDIVLLDHYKEKNELLTELLKEREAKYNELKKKVDENIPD